MRRQAGASDVRLDAQAGYAFLTLGQPAQIDFPGLHEDVYGAGYTTTTIEVEAEFRLVEGGGSSYLELVPSGQRLRLEGKAPASQGRLKGIVSDWQSESPGFHVHDQP